MENIDPTLILFCKRPSLGVGKQRLAKDTNPETAFKVATALHSCAMEDFNNWPGPKILSPSSAVDTQWAMSTAEGFPRVISQPAVDNLGIRIQQVDLQARAAGHKGTVFIGSDCPTITRDIFYRASSGLKDADVVLGPAADGGVYLMASRQPWPDLQLLPWSSDKLFEKLVNLCRSQGFTIKLLPVFSDVDYLADLKEATMILRQMKSPARIHLLNIIDEVLSEHNGQAVHNSQKAQKQQKGL